MKLLRINITFAFIVLCCVVCNAQMLTLNNVTVTSSEGITVKGNILLEAEGHFNNTDTIDLTGDWINNNLVSLGFITNAGTVVLNGINQNIGGTRTTSFWYLTFMNGVKTLLVDVLVANGGVGVLNINDAVFNLNSNECMIINHPMGGAPVTYTTGYILSESADFSGRLIWVTDFLSSNYTIPFGNAAGVAIPFNMPITCNACMITTATYATAANNTPYPSAPLPVTHVRNTSGLDNSVNTVDRFWFVKTTFSFANPFTLSYAPAENAANGNTNVRAQRWNATTQGWDAALPGQSNPTTQSVLVTASNYNSNQGNIWALAQAATPLPVELLAFDAQPVNNKQVLCNWVAASELNNDFFTVERSANTVDFFAIGTVQGHGTTNVQHSYEFLDSNPLSGQSYYRLKQTDYDGAYAYSPVKRVFLTNDNPGFTLYPNPNNGGFYLSSTQPIEGSYDIVNVLNQAVQQGNFDLGNAPQYINHQTLAAGMYYVQLTTHAGSHVYKMEVKK